jgi:hypothetical protein
MIYIQSNKECTLPHHFDAACALYGAIETAQNYKLVTFEEVESGKYDKLIPLNLFVGSVEFMREVFKRVGITPESILNSDRNHIRVPLSYVRENILNGVNISYFVKPFQQKLFSGLVVDKYSISSLKQFSDDLEVMVYGVLPKILSEWRVYVHFNKIVDLKNYSGDFTIFPDKNFINEKISLFSNKLPSTYVMDVGVCLNDDPYISTPNSDKIKNVIIEFNDMYAIGNYGIPNDLYVNMLRTRYFEIIRKEYV